MQTIQSTTKALAYHAIDKGLDTEAIATLTDLSPQTIAAYKAHVTMGRRPVVTLLGQVTA